MNRYEPTTFARLARPHCPECMRQLRWYPLAEAMDVLGAQAVEDTINGADVFWEADEQPEMEFWHCRRCDRSGAFVTPAFDFLDMPEAPQQRAGGPARKRSGDGSPAGGIWPF